MSYTAQDERNDNSGRVWGATATAPHRTHYVAGLLFDDLGDIVLLMRKRKPAWQAGKLNAIGGRIEPGESPVAAMIREFEEEAGARVLDWTPLAVLTGPDFVVHFYFTHDTEALFAARTMEAEPVGRFPTGRALTDPDLIPNLRVLIPLALDRSGIAKPVFLTDLRKAA